ncbi:G-alpha-domain-containing protein [Coprinopsis marcescibilis]|uniref:G-alpha-domain-containing protein n=1 Tax=Coprinopsis marcescibilis TaxID=230819 RepID=A0A5C3KJD1_COPMA|nr:G-alpha-domain-containing protein [Coprinopsis marcescibilis]
MARTAGSIIANDPSDPLAHVTAPPLNETAAERQERLEKETEAKQVSDGIDRDIEAEREATKARKPIKILLLGQSESGKSTTLKNFQLMYDPKAFRLEKASWRAVIQLNLVRSFHVMFDAVTRAQELNQKGENALIIPPELLRIKLRIMPLLAIENILIRRLTPEGSGEVEAVQLGASTGLAKAERTKHYIKEVAINSTKGWKEAFTGNPASPTRQSFESGDDIDWNDPKDPGRVIHECAEDMIKFWNDPIIQRLLNQQNMRMQEVSGFFLDQLDRVTAPRYIPTDDDVLRARLKTLGVTEHRFTLSTDVATGKLIGRDWRVFDVGGHRSQTAAWVPYFDDMDAIIFLAPISCFDQTLAEDLKTNRLSDSVQLWEQLVRNQLLRETNLILFLNKIDIFKAKIKSGVKLADYVVSYGNRPNDFESTVDYLRKKFAGILKEGSPLPRHFYGHLTAVTNTQSTQYILTNLQEMIMREVFVKSSLL